MTDILDQLAPISVGNRPHGWKGARWLSTEAVAAKRLRRRLERRGKAMQSEAVRTEYRQVCKTANRGVNASRSRHRLQRVLNASGDSRRVWSVVKELNGAGTGSANMPEDEENFCQTLASFFLDKVNKIKSSIQSSFRILLLIH